MHLSRRASLLLLLFGAACSGEVSTDGELVSEVRDSAGVTIVENERPADGTRMNWMVNPEPAVSIGSLDGEEAYQLFRISGATRTADGRILVANRGSNEVRVFDSEGVYLASWGGEGEGPGEFSSLASVVRWRGDSIATWDSRQRRISVFDAMGVLGRTFTLETPEGVTSTVFIDRFSDGTLLTRNSAVFTSGEMISDLVRYPRSYMRMDDEGTILNELGEFEGDEQYLMASAQFVSVVTHPYGRAMRHVAWGDGVLLAPNDRYELRVYGPDGALTRVVRREHEGGLPDQADLDAYFEDLVMQNPEEQRAQVRTMFADIPVTDGFPAFAAVVVDQDDFLWVQDFVAPPQTSTLWTVFDPTGRVMGTMETPEGVTVREIGSDYLLGTWEDDLEVEHVRLYSLQRATAN